jgi:hypothetical protein
VLAIPPPRCSRRTRAPNYTVVETGRGYDRLQQAVDAIGNGQGTIAVSPGRHADCAVQEAGYITYLSASRARRSSMAAPARARRRWFCAAAAPRSRG